MPDDNQSWLADVIIVNDNDNYSTAGDVSIYRNAWEAWSDLELWHDREDEHYFALNGLGLPVSLRVSNPNDDSEAKPPGFIKRVFEWLFPSICFGTAGVKVETLGDLIFIEDDHPDKPDLDTLNSWLSATARHILDVRQQKARKTRSSIALGELESKDVLPTSIEGLIAYIGFTA